MLPGASQPMSNVSLSLSPPNPPKKSPGRPLMLSQEPQVVRSARWPTGLWVLTAIAHHQTDQTLEYPDIEWTCRWFNHPRSLISGSIVLFLSFSLKILWLLLATPPVFKPSRQWHQGQGGIYPAGPWWVHCEFWNNELTLGLPGKYPLAPSVSSFIVGFSPAASNIASSRHSASLSGPLPRPSVLRSPHCWPLPACSIVLVEHWNNKWVVRMNESAKNKGKDKHGKG